MIWLETILKRKYWKNLENKNPKFQTTTADTAKMFRHQIIQQNDMEEVWLLKSSGLEILIEVQKCFHPKNSHSISFNFLVVYIY